MSNKNRTSPVLPKILVRKLSPDIIVEYNKSLLAQTVPYEDGDMVYHPALQHLGCGGFFSDPQECVEMLHAHKPDVPKRFRIYCFATTRQACQGLDIHDLIESAAQDMFEDWQDRVEGECSTEIKIVQAALDALHHRFLDFPTFHADFSRTHILPEIVWKRSGIYE